MPTEHLNRILADIGPYQAEYKPVQTPEGENESRPPECALPDFSAVDLTPDPFVPPTILKDCIVGFIPTPLAPAPFVDLSDIEIPCAPDGFLFRSNEAGSGTITYNVASVGVIESQTVYLIQGTGTEFVTEIQDLVDLGAPYPNLEITVADVVYTARVHSVVESLGVYSAVQLWLRSKFRDPEGNELNVTQTDVGYVIKRIVFTTSPDAPTSGDLFFIKTDALGCSGAFVGDININIADVNLDVPCPTVGAGSASGNIKLVNHNYDPPVGANPNFQEQEFSYQLVSGGAPGACTFTLQLTGAADLEIPKLIFSNAGNVDFFESVDLASGDRTIWANGPAGGGGGSNCCVWQ